MQKYQIPKRASADTNEYPPVTTAPVSKRTSPRAIVFFVVCLGLCIFFILTHFVLPWWQDINNQWHYGDNKVTVFDGGDMGHGGDSTFIALVWQEKIVVVELVNGVATTYNDIGEARGIVHPLIEIHTTDVNGDSKPDLIVHVVGSEVDFVLFNTDKGFSLTKP